MNSLPQSLQFEIDLLVENEMDEQERKRLFEQLDASENGWKVCALAFLERRALADSLSLVVAGAVDSSDAQWPTTENDVSARETGSSNPLAKQSVRRPQDKPIRHSGRYRWLSLMLATAAVAVIFLFGFMAGLNRDGRIEVENDSPQQRAVVSSEHPMAGEFAQPDAETLRSISNAVARIGVDDSEIVALVGIRSEHQKTELLPVIASPTLERQYVSVPKPQLSSQYTQQLARAGWKLNCVRQFLSMDRPDGKNEVRPFDMFNYRFVGKSTF